MATKELSAYISQRIRQLGVTKTQVIRRSKLSRQTFYNILNDNILEETKLSTFISLAHAIEVHPLILIRQYFHGWELSIPRTTVALCGM
jgi:lambda repressor-like predicted transcriptional regulator